MDSIITYRTIKNKVHATKYLRRKRSLNTLAIKRPKEFEEKVVLLTEKALYICSYNYSLEKVVQFRRLELGTIKSIQMGEYILSSLTMASRDEEQNYGFIIDYSTNGETTRWNTGSILNQVLDDLNLENGEDEGLESTDHCLAIFKAVRYNVLGELDGKVETCKKQVENIVKSIAIATGNTPDDPEFITNEPIIRYSEKKETQN